MSSLSNSVRQHIAQAMAEAGYGERTDLAKRLAATYGVSASTIYKHAKRGGASRKRQANKQHYRKWVRVAVALAHSVPGDPLPLDLAIAGAIENGSLPMKAKQMPVQTAYRIAREQGLVKQKKRTHRLNANYPMQAIQIDGSSSECLVVNRVLSNGEYQLRLHRRPYSASGYKNKPLGPDRLRVLVYSVWDMCTGYTLSRYYIAKGELALDAMSFLCWSLSGNIDKRIPFHGVPCDLWSDQGALFKSGPARDLVERLDINLVTGEAYAKERMGGVERTHRTRWRRFEKSLFLRDEDTLTLSELNARLIEFSIAENAKRNTRATLNGRKVSRTDAWIALTNARTADNRLRKLPENPIETMAQEVRRRVDQNGIFSWNNIEYELSTVHDCWVIARRAMDGSGNVIVEDERDGRKYIATTYQARDYGQIVGSPTTALDKLIDETGETTTSADLYAPLTHADSNVFTMLARSSASIDLENPLDAAHYANIDQAMQAFVELWPYELGRTNYNTIRDQIIDRGLSKSFITELAQELLTLPQTNNGEHQ